jgi:alkylation response protein AidB-like acyl-CoA dehydrogenase
MGMAGIEALLQRPAPDTRDPATTATTVRTLLAAGAADLPLPGRGVTAARLGALRSLARWDVVAGRLIEAHADAVAILADLDPDGAGVEPGQWWGVWAAEPPGPAVDAYPATDGSGGWQLRGRKHWCSGAGLCTHALITARSPDGGRRLFALSLDEPGVRPVPGGWESAGMAGSDTRSVDLTGAAAREVGEPSGYLQRPGFWHGAIGVAACWLGGTDAVLDSLLRAAARLDPHGLAHLGACAASVHAAQAELSTAAASVDADPLDRSGIGRLVALRARAVVERAAGEVIERVGRALGSAPLVQDAAHARHVADLQIYLRQSHAERDLATLGELVAAASGPGRR